MKRLILYALLPMLCFASCYAFYFLNTVEVKPMAAAIHKEQPKKEQKKIVITDPKTHKKQVIVIEPPKWIDTTDVVRDSKNEKVEKKDSRGYLPDVELLKFVIQKGREGLPVLSIGNFLNF